MDAFKIYLDKITASPELKEKTKDYIQTKLADQSKHKTAVISNSFATRRLIIGISTLVACMVLAISGWTYCTTPVNYVSLDINPSVELGLNTFDKVVSVEAYNEDGDALLKGTDISWLPLDQALDALVTEAANQGYLAKDGSTVIAVTAESNSKNDAADLQKASRESISSTLLTQNIQAIVYANCSNLELRTKAKELGISPGKYKLIAILCELDPTINPEDCRNMKITDIIVKFNEIITDSSADADDSDSELTDDTGIQLIVDTANQVMNAQNNGNKEEKTNRGQQNSIKNGDEDELDEDESDEDELDEDESDEDELDEDESDEDEPDKDESDEDIDEDSAESDADDQKLSPDQQQIQEQKKNDNKSSNDKNNNSNENRKN